MNNLIKKYQNLSEEELKKEFIKYFGEEKWNEEEILSDLLDFQFYVFDDLQIEPIPVIFENIEEDSRLYVRDGYIAISRKLKDDKIECAKCIVHEARHAMQIIYVGLKIEHPMLPEWQRDLIGDKEINSNSTNEELTDYISSTIEVDAFAYQKYIINKYYGVMTYHPNEEYENILNYYIKKMFN